MKPTTSHPKPKTQASTGDDEEFRTDGKATPRESTFNEKGLTFVLNSSKHS